MAVREPATRQQTEPTAHSQKLEMRRLHLFSCVVLRGSGVVLGDADTRHEGCDAGGEVRVEVLISATNHGKVVRFVRLFRRRDRHLLILLSLSLEYLDYFCVFF